MPSVLQALRDYLPDKAVLDEHPAFDDDVSQPLFHPGSRVGCITLHGIGGTPANIRVVADALIAGGCTVLSPTLPGHGETVRAQNASTDREWLACVEHAYDQLVEAGCTQIFCLGLSLGGVLTGLLATERPLAGAALICAPLRTQRFLNFARIISPILPCVRYPSDDKPENSWRLNPYAQMYNGFSTVKLRDLARLMRRLRKNLARITCPVLCINARFDDKVAPVSIDLLKKGLTNAASTEFVMLENSPHGCTYGPERDLVARLCANFVAAHTVPA